MVTGTGTDTDTETELIHPSCAGLYGWYVHQLQHEDVCKKLVSVGRFELPTYRLEGGRSRPAELNAETYVVVWCPRKDLNPRPVESESTALIP